MEQIRLPSPGLRWKDTDGVEHGVTQAQMDLVMMGVGDKVSFVDMGLMLRELEGWHAGQCMRLLRVLLHDVRKDEAVDPAYRERAAELLKPFGLTEWGPQ